MWEFDSLQGVFRSLSTSKEVSIKGTVDGAVGADDSIKQGFKGGI